MSGGMLASAAKWVVQLLNDSAVFMVMLFVLLVGWVNWTFSTPELKTGIMWFNALALTLFTVIILAVVRFDDDRPIVRLNVEVHSEDR